MVVVPNAKLAQASITNFDLPDRRIGVSVRVPVAYGQDPRRVLLALRSAAEDCVGKISGLASSPAPTASFNPGFGDRAMEFTIDVHLQGVEFEAAVKSELRQRAAEKLAEGGIALIQPEAGRR